MPIALRRFRVHARHVDRHHSRLVQEASFEAAAVAYVEDFVHETGPDADVSIIVEEVGSSHQHCFRIDLETGEATPCA